MLPLLRKEVPGEVKGSCMAEKVIFPQVSGVNWPSNVLHAWLTLHSIGVPEQNIRFLPEIAHFASPEVMEEPLEEDPDPDAADISLRHPSGPSYDPRSGRTTVHYVDPEQVRPRLKVNVRAETLLRVLYDEQGRESELQYRLMGRLADFMAPMMAGLFGESEAATSEQAQPLEKPLTRLTREVCARYPELMETLPSEWREALDRTIQHLEKALTADDPATRRRFGGEAARVLEAQADLYGIREAFLTLAGKLSLEGREQTTLGRQQEITLRFRRWAEILFQPGLDPRSEAIVQEMNAWDAPERENQHFLLRRFQTALNYEYPQERQKIVREMLEIFTTEVFNAVAVSDLLWGLGFIHGPMAEFRLNAGRRDSDLLLTVTGGLGHRAVLLTLLQQWTEEGAFLGVGTPEPPSGREAVPDRTRLDVNLFTPEEQAELWSLVAWRREAADPLILLETAAQRLVHPGVRVELKRFVPAPSRMGSLFAQPAQRGDGTGTAVLGGKALLQYPGVVIYMPLAEDSDEPAIKAKAALEILKRLFVPVCFHIETVWQEAVARLDRPSYLQHPFQQGIRLRDDRTVLSAKDKEPVYDQLTLG